ncbi:MAG: hypothetical protein JXQ30_14310 [Spirochaetes bacterium]|nr:hypothetical protein [Spirochaetota bacterium]
MLKKSAVSSRTGPLLVRIGIASSFMSVTFFNDWSDFDQSARRAFFQKRMGLGFTAATDLVLRYELFSSAAVSCFRVFS